MGIITRKEAESGLDPRLCKKPQYRTFLKGVKGGDDPSKLEILGGVALVPPTDLDGNVPGENSPYGTVVQGEVIGQGMRARGLVDMNILARRTRRPVRQSSIVAAPPPPAEDADEGLTSADIAARTVPAGAEDSRVAANAQRLQEFQLATPAPAPRPTIMVELEGAFGKARLNCLCVERRENIMILVQEKDANVFEPPASDQPCTLTCQTATGSVSAKVFAVGLAFPIELLSIFVQVFILEA
jgi:hypothetical protein